MDCLHKFLIRFERVIDNQTLSSDFQIFYYDNQGRITTYQSRYGSNSTFIKFVNAIIFPLQIGGQTNTLTLTYTDTSLIKESSDAEDSFTELYDKKENFINGKLSEFTGMNKIEYNDSISYYLNNEGNLITIEHYNKKGNLISALNYTYGKDNNIIKITINEFLHKKVESVYEYEYDNKKSPFTHCNTPKWWLQKQLPYSEFTTKNNITKILINGENEYKYIYEYNDAGLPIKCEKYYNGNKEDDIEFSYY
jgi:hypothetical protein